MWRIHSATPADIDSVEALLSASPLLRRYRLSDPRGMLEEALAAGDLVLIAKRETDAIAMAWVIFSRALGLSAYLRLLLVAQDKRRAGLGSALLGSVERAAHDRANHLYLLVTADNLAARRFYTRHGYREVGDLPGLVWPDLDEVLYHKALRVHGARL